MADTEILRIIDDKLSQIHDKVNTQSVNLATYTERITQHIQNRSIHEPVPAQRKTCDELEKHKVNHSEIVKKDVSSIIGKAVIALLLSGSGIGALIAYIVSK